MVMIAVGGVAWVFLYPVLSGERRGEKRIQAVRSSESRVNVRKKRDEAVVRSNRTRKVAETLKEIEDKSKGDKTRPTLRLRLTRAGLKISPQQYYIFSAIFGVIVALLSFLIAQNALIAIAVLVAAGLGFPRWLLGFLTKRRQKKFLHILPNAIDVIVRGVKAGLPLNDCLRIIARESEEPVRGEIRDVVESQAVGMSPADAIARVYDRVPVAEVNFFAITIAIQQQSGGNLSEALSNLSKVLRDRKKMKQKVISLSQEAKASAMIIGSLPFAVMLLLTIFTEDYMSLLWTDSLGQILMVASGVWMLLGVLVMRKMINFDF
ncbi:MAG: type II secretion system F family protein [Pseudomonadota bacterium]